MSYFHHRIVPRLGIEIIWRPGPPAWQKYPVGEHHSDPSLNRNKPGHIRQFCLCVGL